MKKSVIIALLITFISLTGCADIADQNIPQPSEAPAVESAAPSKHGVVSGAEDTAVSETSVVDFSEPGVYEITKDTAYSLEVDSNGVKVSIFLKGITNADGDACTALVVDDTENNVMDIAADKLKAYVIRKDNGNVGVLISGEGNSDIMHNTYVYGFDGSKAVRKTSAGYEAISLTTQSITLQGTRNVFGSWVISNDCVLNDDFSIMYSDGGYFTVHKSITGEEYLDTKMDIPVQMLDGSVYKDTTLPAWSRIYPTSFGNANNQICLVFKTENGTTCRIFTDFGEHSYNISGIDEYDIFVYMPYADT